MATSLKQIIERRKREEAREFAEARRIAEYAATHEVWFLGYPEVAKLVHSVCQRPDCPHELVIVHGESASFQTIRATLIRVLGLTHKAYTLRWLNPGPVRS